MIQKYQSELDKILISCNICKAKLCIVVLMEKEKDI